MKLYSSAGEALDCIQSGQSVFIQGAAATPFELIDGLMEHAERVKNVEILHLHTLGDARYTESRYEANFRTSSLFIGPNLRMRMHPGGVDYLPCFLSEIPNLFRSGRKRLNIALIQVSPPDRHGFCTLGVSVDVTKSAIETADIVIAEVNRQMPRVFGDGVIHSNDIDRAIEVDRPLPTVTGKPLSDDELRIGRWVADLIEDGSTLQAGIGAVPDAVLASLDGHKNLGLHTEMWSDGALRLIQKGVIDNSKKKIARGKTVSGFVYGSQEIYRFIDDNPSVIHLDTAYVNDASVIAQNPKVVAINSAVEMDLTGQVCADSIGPRIISGAGGQMDFIRGAGLSEGGKPIIAMTSRTSHGLARITAQLQPGAGVVTTRAHVHYVVTEFGVADLYGKTLDERAEALIGIAHPQDRDSLTRAWRDIWK